MNAGILDGIRVLDLGHALAGPYAATMLGDFGAEVIKVERPGRGDAMRQLGPRKDGKPLWWKAAARNKRSITLDFTQAEGREILLDLVRVSDVLVENFRPGTLERHDLGWERLHELNPRLVMLRISGFGQEGPEAHRPGFGRIAEAMSGAAQLTGEPDGPPIHVGYSLADTLTGLTGAYGVLLCLLGRERGGEGMCIDLALYESLFRLIDWQVIVHDQLGIVPERAGNAFPGVLAGVAAGAARSADGVWVSYSAATDSVLERMVRLAFGEAGLEDPRFADAESRRLHVAELREQVEAWIGERSFEEVESAFAAAHAVAGPVFDMERISRDPQVRFRENVIAVEDSDFGEVRMHGVVPRVVEAPGEVRSVGPELGEHTAEVLGEVLGIEGERVEELRRAGVV
jgi:formyl-CoA transferase